MENKKNPIIKMDWGELKRWRPSRSIILVGLFLIFSLFLANGAIGRYRDLIIRYDAQIEAKEKEREKAEAAQVVAEDNLVVITEEAEERDADAERTIIGLQRNITTLNRANITLRSANDELQDELELVPDEIESASDEELADSIPPKIDTAYPQFSGSTFRFDGIDGLFKGDRMFASAVRFSLEEVLSLRLQTHNQGVIMGNQENEILQFRGIVTEKDIQILTWKDRLAASTTLGLTKDGTISAFEGEKDAWEDKSKAQARQIFWYRWTSRVGIGSAVILGIVAVTK